MRDRFNQVALRNRGWQLVREVINATDGDSDSLPRVLLERNHDAYEKVAMLAYLVENKGGRYAMVPDIDRAIKEMILGMI